MLKRRCLLCPREAIAGGSRCAQHGGTTPRNPAYDATHRRLAAQAVARATHCAECGGRLDRPGPYAKGPYDPPQGDHIIPLAQGGTNTPDNYQATHRSCNIRKGGTPPTR